MRLLLVLELFSHNGFARSMNDLALEGLKQITLKQYDAPLKHLPHIKQILKLCIVFYGKQFVYKYVMEPITQ